MGTKITALPQVLAPQGTDELPISQDVGGGSRTTYKATLDQIKNYVKNTGGGTGTVTSVAISSTDGSIEVFGSPITSSGTITVDINSVGLDKLESGGALSGQVLTYDGSTSTWVASAVPKELPQTATGQQVLTYNGSTSTWVASAAPSPNPNSFYTTVGNASAGIFASAVCFTPSNPGTGTWTAPAGCFTARVTIVGGGNASTSAGGRSHFNYPSGTTTAANQLFATAGANGSVGGGTAGWNGLNNVAVGNSSIVGRGGAGGAGNGGYGGSGGNGGSYNTDAGGGGSYGGRGGDSSITSSGGGGSGGVSGNGNPANGIVGGAGGGAPVLSYAATSLPNFPTQFVGMGVAGGAGAGWCSAIVSVTPGQSYSYAVGAASSFGGYPGMVVIEW